MKSRASLLLEKFKIKEDNGNNNPTLKLPSEAERLKKLEAEMAELGKFVRELAAEKGYNLKEK